MNWISVPPAARPVNTGTGVVFQTLRVGDDYPVKLLEQNLMPLCWLVVPGSHEVSVPGRSAGCAFGG